MTRRLALDTSGIEYAIVLIEDERLVGAAAWSRLPGGGDPPIIARLTGLLAGAGWSVADLHGVAAGRGPGSFTGLRVGLSIAVGLAYGREVPLFLIDSLEAVAARDRELAATAALRDAGRGEVYAWRENAGVARLPVAAIMTWLRPDDRVVVEPAGALRRWSEHQASLEVPTDHQRPFPEALALTANQVFGRQKPVRYHEIAPLYAQPAAAEERREKQP